MKVKIKKEGKTKQFKLISSWEDVTLEKWAKLIAIKGFSKIKEAKETILALSDIPEKVLNKLEDFSKTPINEEMVKDVFYIQDLVEEVKK